MKDTALQRYLFVKVSARSESMPRFGKRVLISSSQEEALERITGWDDTSEGAGVFDETPSQHRYTENSSQSSLERVFDVSGPSFCSGPSQEAVEFVSPSDMPFPSPRSTGNVALEEREEKEEDSYNKAFENDRSQSPPRTVSWSVPAAAHGCKDGLKSPTTSTTLTAAAVEEVGKLPLSSNLKLVCELEVSNRPSDISPEAASVAIGVRPEMEVDQEALAAEERSGRREGSANGDGGGGSKTTADCEADQHVSSIGIGLVPRQGSSLPKGSPALEPSSIVGKGFGSGSGSAFKTLRRKEKDSQTDFQPALSGEHHNECGLELASSLRTADNVLDQIAYSVQVNMRVVDKMVNMLVVDKMDVVEGDNWGNGLKSGDKSEKTRSRVQHELDTVEGVAEREVRVERVTLSKVSTDELGTPLAADQCQGGKQFLSWQEKSRELLRSPTPSKGAMAAANSVDKTRAAAVAACSTEGDGQCSLSSPPRPPRAVQEKLDNLRNQSGLKRARSKSFNLLEEKMRTERDMVSASTVLEVTRLRSDERPVTGVTAADLLKTALDVGITLPPPFHRNYFSK